MKSTYKYYMLTKALIKTLLLSIILCLAIVFAIITSINIVTCGYQYTINEIVSHYLSKPAEYITHNIKREYGENALCLAFKQAFIVINNYKTSVRIIYTNYTLLSTFFNLKIDKNTVYVGHVLVRTLGLKRNTAFTLEVNGKTHIVSNWSTLPTTDTDLDLSIILPTHNASLEKYDYCLVKNNVSSLKLMGVGDTGLFVKKIMLNIFNIVVIWKYLLISVAAIVSSIAMIKTSLSRIGTLRIFRSLGVSLKEILVSYIVFSVLAILLSMAVGFSLGTIVSYIVVKTLSLTLEMIPFAIHFNWPVLMKDYLLALAVSFLALTLSSIYITKLRVAYEYS